MKDNGIIRKRRKKKRKNKQVRVKKKIPPSTKHTSKRGGVIFGVLEKSRESEMTKNINQQYDTPMHVQPYGIQERKSMLLLDENKSNPLSVPDNSSFNLHSYKEIANLANRLKQTTTIKINETYVGENWETKWNEGDAVIVAQQLADKFDKEQKRKSQPKTKPTPKKSTPKKKLTSKRKFISKKRSVSKRKSTQRKDNFFQSIWNWFI